MVKVPKVLYWLPTLFWMIVIFGFSAQPSLHASAIDWQDFLIKKSAHVTEYFILGLLLNFSLKKTTSLSVGRRCLLLIIMGMVYASTDEYHQTFIAGREGRVRDVLIDCIGILGSAGILTFFKSRPRITA